MGKFRWDSDKLAPPWIRPLEQLPFGEVPARAGGAQAQGRTLGLCVELLCPPPGCGVCPDEPRLRRWKRGESGAWRSARGKLRI